MSIPPPLAPFLTPDRAGELVRAGLYADDLDGLRTANDNLRALWAATIERALRLDPAQLEERAGGEWSFIETLSPVGRCRTLVRICSGGGRHPSG